MDILILGAALVALTLSLDAFVAAFAYGCKQIRIPFRSGAVVAVICTATTYASFWVGAAVLPVLSVRSASWLAAGVLLAIGTAKLLDSLTKSLIRKHADISGEISVSLFNFKFILRVYADPEAADADVSHSICAREAAVLAVSLSVDGFAVGLGAALMGMSGIWVMFFCLGANALALWLGSALGNKAANSLRFNLSWAAGVILIALGVGQIM